MTDCEFIIRVLSIMGKYDGRDALFWRTDGEYAPITLMVICNDLFEWGCGDAEPITPENIDELEQACADCHAFENPNLSSWCEFDAWGPQLFCARVRKMRPQGAAYPKEELKELWPLLDACGPQRSIGQNNPKPAPTDQAVNAQIGAAFQ